MLPPAVDPEPAVPVSVMLGAAAQAIPIVPDVVIGEPETVKSVVLGAVRATLVTVPDPLEHAPQVGALPLLYWRHCPVDPLVVNA
jgi:hypothetical protein